MLLLQHQVVPFLRARFLSVDLLCYLLVADGAAIAGFNGVRQQG